MASVNKVILVGNLGADPEVRYTQGGEPVCELRLATSEQWTDKAGARQERTEWHTISAWGKTAELCGQYLAKGRSVYVEGSLRTREYVDKEGVNRKAWEVRADKVTFLGGGEERAAPSARAADRGAGPTAGAGGGGWRGGRSQGGSGHSSQQGGFDDDPIPF
jgi:single-strand DNA-binding protein